jgi:hypothetical protein
MERIILFTLAVLMTITFVGPAAAGDETTAVVGTARIGQKDLQQVRDLVAGRGVTAAASPAAEAAVDAGRVQLSSQEMNQIRAMIREAGGASDRTTAATDETRNVGRVEMCQAEYDLRKRRVDEHLKDVRALMASARQR